MIRQWNLTGSDTDEIIKVGEAILYEDGTLSVHLEVSVTNEHFNFDFHLDLSGQEVIIRDDDIPF